MQKTSSMRMKTKKLSIVLFFRGKWFLFRQWCNDAKRTNEINDVMRVKPLKENIYQDKAIAIPTTCVHSIYLLVKSSRKKISFSHRQFWQFHVCVCEFLIIKYRRHYVHSMIISCIHLIALASF